MHNVEAQIFLYSGGPFIKNSTFHSLNIIMKYVNYIPLHCFLELGSDNRNRLSTWISILDFVSLQ